MYTALTTIRLLISLGMSLNWLVDSQRLKNLSRNSLVNHEEVKWKLLSHVLTLCDPMDYIVHGILKARILEWVAIPFSRGSSQPRERTQVSHFAGQFFTSWATRKAPSQPYGTTVVIWEKASWFPFYSNWEISERKGVYSPPLPPQHTHTHSGLLLLLSCFSCVRLCVTP